LTPLFRKIALRTHFMDTPTGQLKKHTAPVPYMGGLALYFSFLLSVLAVVILVPPPDSSKLLALLAGGTVVALLGLVDDLFALGPGLKFVVQLAAAALLYFFGVRLEFMPTHPVLGFLVTVFWVTLATNALNLVDIMDGLAAGLALTACLGFVLVPFVGDQSYVPLAAAGLGGALLGFLPYNIQPARIYMGDSGALFLGFILAGMAMGHGYSKVNVVALSAPLLILGVPLYDTLLVMALRMLKGKSMFRGSNDHLALRLRALGLSVHAVVGLLWSASLLLSAFAWFLVRASDKRAILAILALFAVTLAFTLFVAQIAMESPRTASGDPRRIFAGGRSGTRIAKKGGKKP
jgi:UDP-GlcNAc:undecaprenyl-phosphate/decaprenyl-phosphate GlcNAc-1-phosphate transferase